MKKHLLALAALATVSGAAFAQSNVSVYGIIDQSVTHVNSSNASGQTANALTSSVWLPSVLGFTGSEDLGGGLKATFQLEADLNTDTGANASTTTLFRRISTVGLSSTTYGTVKAGKQIDPLFLQSFLNNVRLAHSASLAVQGQLAYGAKGSSAQTADTASTGARGGSAADLGVFLQNAISYTTPTIAGFNLQYLHGFGEVAGNTSKNETNALLLTGKIAGVAVSAGHESQKDSSGNKSLTKNLLGAVYSIGPVQLNAGLNTFKNPGSTIDATGYEVGAAYSFTPALVGAVNYVSIKDDYARTTTKNPSASLKYSFSKRTSVWGLVSSVDPKTTGTGGVSIPVSALYNAFNFDSKKQTGYAVGLTHTF